MTLCATTMTICGIMILCNLQKTCMPFRRTICVTHNATLFYNDIMYPHNDFCALIMTLCAHTRTLCGLIATLSFPVNDADIPSNELCHHNSSCHAHVFCMTLTVTLCEMHNDLLWCSQWFYVLSQWLCVKQTRNECVCPYNDSVIYKIMLCSFSKTLWYLHNGFVHHYNDNMQYSQWLCMTFTMSLCDFTMIYMPSKWGCAPSQWLFVIFIIPYFHNKIWLWLWQWLFDFKMTLCGLTMTLCDLIMSSHALTMIMSDFHSDCVTITISLYDNDSVWSSQ